MPFAERRRHEEKLLADRKFAELDLPKAVMVKQIRLQNTD
jgi:hypothetical protein